MSNKEDNNSTVISDEPQLRSVARRSGGMEVGALTRTALDAGPATASKVRAVLPAPSTATNTTNNHNNNTNAKNETSTGGKVKNESTIDIVATPAGAVAEEEEELSRMAERLSSSSSSSPPPIQVGEYNCDLVQEYQRSRGRCFFVLDDCPIDQVNAFVEQFLTTAKDKGKLMSLFLVARPATTDSSSSSSSSLPSSTAPHPLGGCWDCQLLCGGGRILIRTAVFPPDNDDDDDDECCGTSGGSGPTTTRSLVQVYRCSGCCYGTHVLRQKLFQYLKASCQQQRTAAAATGGDVSLSSSASAATAAAAAFDQQRPIVPFDFMECTTAMRQEFQYRIRALLKSDRSDCRELGRQALLAVGQESSTTSTTSTRTTTRTATTLLENGIQQQH